VCLRCGSLSCQPIIQALVLAYWAVYRTQEFRSIGIKTICLPHNWNTSLLLMRGIRNRIAARAMVSSGTRLRFMLRTHDGMGTFRALCFWMVPWFMQETFLRLLLLCFLNSGLSVLAWRGHNAGICTVVSKAQGWNLLKSIETAVT